MSEVQDFGRRDFGRLSLRKKPTLRTVIDVGCSRIGADYSIERLLDMFKPDVLHGFDPIPNVSEAMPALTAASTPVAVVLHRTAAWTYDGEVGFVNDGLTSHLTDDPAAPKVRCIDIARFIDELPAGPVILKIDAEGAEYEILEHLISRGTDLRLERLLVEWHPRGEGKRRHGIEMNLGCTVEQWRW